MCWPVAELITHNLHEAAKLTDMPLAEDDAMMIEQAQALLGCGAKAVLVKGGHGGSDTCSDLLAFGGRLEWFHAERIDTNNTHGTGCSLSSAIASELAKGKPVIEAVENAKDWLTQAIQHSDELDVGAGPGPVHHFHNLWSK